MNSEEVLDWVRHHKAAFVGLARWLNELPAGTTKDDVLRAWAAVLSDVALSDAKNATDAMARGDEEEPMGFDRHPRAIRLIALRAATMKRAASRMTTRDTREERVYCPLCRDSGAVLVWHPKSMLAALDGTLGNAGTLYTLSIACACTAGDSVASMMSKSAGREDRAHEYRFRPEVMLPAPTFLDDQAAQEALREFAHAAHARAADRRFHEFDQFGG